MRLWLIVLFIIVLLLLFVLFIPVGIGLRYENEVLAVFKIGALKFSSPLNIKGGKKKEKKKEGEKPENEPEKKLEEGIDKLDFFLDLMGDFRRFIRKTTTLSDFEVRMKIGTGNAASTAVAVGAVWGLLGVFTGLIDLLAEVKKPVYEVKPEYGEAVFSITAGGIIVTRIAYIIAAAIVFVWKYLKYKKSKTKEETR